jgi:hypothetical protein
MRSTVGFAFIACLVGAPALPSVAAPVLNPANGHYYELIVPTQGITWTDANAAANGSSFMGMPGHLATFSSQAEFTFAYTTFPRNFVWIGFTDAAQEGNYQWANGEPVVYTAWHPNEPNNAASGGGEDYAWYESRTLGFGWNDYQNVATVIGLGTPIAYLVEYSVPEPATGLLLLAGGVLAFGSRRRTVLARERRVNGGHR